MSFYRILLFTLSVGVLAVVGCDSGGNTLDEAPDPEIRLVGQLAIENENPNAISSDVWGYVDANTGKEYALIGGLGQGTRVMNIVDVSDPAVPVLTASIDVPGFDMKVWRNYAYTVTGGGDQGKTHGVGSVLLGHFDRVNYIALGLRHLLLVGVANQPMDIDLAEGDVACHLDAQHDHPGHPEE